MSFNRIKELEAKIEALEKELKHTKIERGMMKMFIHDINRVQDYNNFFKAEYRDARAQAYRNTFKVIEKDQE